MLSGASGVHRMDGGWRCVDSPFYRGRVDAIAARGAGHHMWKAGMGDLQMVPNPKDASPYYFSISENIHIITMRLYFCFLRLRLVNRISFLLNPILISGAAYL